MADDLRPGDAPALDHDPRPGTLPLGSTALGALGIELVACSPDGVTARMPVTGGVESRGLLLVLAETAASTAAGLAVGPGRRAFGAELNASWPATAREGLVHARAEPLQLGPSLHVWSITCSDADGSTVLLARCSLGIVDAPTAGTQA
jgi:uncharacterized protein (TIGR00369 family)